MQSIPASSGIPNNQLVAAFGRVRRLTAVKYGVVPKPKVDGRLAELVRTAVQEGTALPGTHLTEHMMHLWLQRLEESSWKTLVSKIRKFLEFCVLHERQAVPADVNTMMLFIAFLSHEGRVAAGNFERYISAVRTLHVLILQEPPPSASHPVLSGLIVAAQKVQRVDEPEAPRLPLPASVLQVAVGMARWGRSEDPPAFLLAMCLIIKYFFGVRGSTVRSLAWGHVRVSPPAVSITWVREKPRCTAKSWRRVTMEFPYAPVFCENIQELLDLQAKAGNKRDLFSWEGVAWVQNPSRSFACVLDMLGVEQPAGGRYQGHSTRSGFAASCRALGVPIEVFSEVAGWALGSSAVFRYLKHQVPSGAVAFACFGALLPHVLQEQALVLYGDELPLLF